jgi:1-acyl-sn-glycerol-3-phosphate acyltransferase
LFTLLPKPIRGVLVSILVISSTVFWCIPLYLFAFLRFVGPATAEPWCTRRAMNMAELWIDCNNLFMGLFAKIDIEVRGGEDLSPTNWYLVFSNHQSWADIIILQRVLNRKIPMLKFFIKQQLIYVPVIGIAWWALDFPIMKRYSREYLKKHPEDKGKDLEATRKACEKFKMTPVAILNFLEGTRYSPAKSVSQNSPHKHLLQPKGGGAALVINSLGDKLDCILNITIHYPDGAPGFFEFLCGHTERATVIIERLPVPIEDTESDSGSGVTLKEDFRQWINGVWQEKDKQLDVLGSE